MKLSEDPVRQQYLQVDDLVIDLQRHMVHRGGVRLPVKSRSFQLLQALIASYPEIAGHRELMAGVWNGLVVTPDALSQRVRLLRKELDDKGGDAGYIASVHGRGYRLVHPPLPIAEPGRGVKKSSFSRGLAWGLVAVTASLLVLIALTDAPHVIKHFFKHM